MKNPISHLFKLLFACAIPSLCWGYYQTQLTYPENQAHTLEEIFLKGESALAFRARYEYVDVDSFANLQPFPLLDGQATTLSSRLSYNTAWVCDFFGLMEFNNVTSYFNSRQNSGNDTTPSKINFAEIPDPKGTALEQVNIVYMGIPDTTIVLGRQKIKLDNERFVGPFDFRQMPHTFDSISILNHSLMNVELFYAFISQVNSIWQGNERALFQQRANTTHLLNVSSRLYPFGNLIGYGYLITDEDISFNSTNTFGLRYLGNFDFSSVNLYIIAEYARQNERANNPVDFHANYYHLNGGVRAWMFDIGTGFEVLGGSSAKIDQQFRTPLASGHIFNGLADKFIIIPQPGLADLYVNAKARFWEITIGGQYHHFKAASGDATFGHEWDFSISKPLFKYFALGIEYADFSGRPDNGFADTKKYWVTATANFG